MSTVLPQNNVLDGTDVLKDGVKINTDLTENLTMGRLVEMMVGRELSEYFPEGARPTGPADLEQLCQPGTGRSASVHRFFPCFRGRAHERSEALPALRPDRVSFSRIAHPGVRDGRGPA